MRLGFKVVGVPEVAGALDRMGDKMGGQRLVDATMSGAGLLVNAWKQIVSVVTGQYRKSIHAEVTQQGPGFVQVTVGTDIVKPPYPWVLEYGMTIKVKTAKWLTFKTKDGAWHRVKQVVIPPKGWARRAFDENKDKVAQEIHDALGDLIDKEWR